MSGYLKYIAAVLGLLLLGACAQQRVRCGNLQPINVSATQGAPSGTTPAPRVQP